MRYYAIVIKGAPAAFPVVAGASQPGAQWDTYPNGKNSPAAQQIEFSLSALQTGEAAPGSWLTIHGIPFEQIKQAADLAKTHATIYGGMSPGLPLATMQSKHDRFLVSGEVYQCFGNWIGTDMSLTIVFSPAGAETGSNAPPPPPPTGISAGSPTGNNPVVSPARQFASTGPRSLAARDLPVAPSALDAGISIGGLINMLTTGLEQIGANTFVSLFSAGGNIAKPLNLIHNMQPNQLLSAAIRETLQRAFPKAKLDIAISPLLKLAYQDAGMYQSLPQYAAYLKQLSHSILGGGGDPKGYAGVHITTHGDGLRIFDKTGGGQSADGTGGAGKPGELGSGGVKQIDYTELIGQPTWIEPQKISIKVVLRGDIRIGDKVQLPPTLVTTQLGVAQQLPGGTDETPKLGALSFEGVFSVTEVLHTGDFRNPDGGAWCTTYQATVEPGAGSGQDEQDKAAKNAALADRAQNPLSSTSAIAPSPIGGRAAGPVMARTVRRY